ncbi:MAG: hypothetical protein LQ346_007310 [Caloplaca aetnensis]|nr:MAG: hypothetical protein LQ346_007310 [Caloplaca aetnensis]
MDSGYGYGGSMEKGNMDQKDTMSADQKNAMDAKSGSNEAVADAPVAVISSYKGGMAPVEKMAEPAMAKGMTHMVTVGGDAGLVFSPSSVMAAPGDMVEFTFMSTNHTLTQSTFPQPCVKMQGGADSGFLPNPNNTISPPPTYMFQVMDTKPTWWYCKQKKPTSHCGKGMTFSINPTADKSQEMFMQMAMQQNGTAAAAGATGAMVMGSSSSMMMPTSTVLAQVTPPASTSTPAAAPPVVSPPPAAAPAASPPPAVVSPDQPQNNAAAAPASPPAMAPGSSVVTGSGSMVNGQCGCSCLCGVAAFPAGAGMGMVGGLSGAVPA